MVFNSFAYLLFLSLTAATYYLLPSRFRWICLLVASVGYYLSFMPIFILLLILIIASNFFLAKSLATVVDKRKPKVFITVIILNVVILAFFKYFNLLFNAIPIHIYKVDIFFPIDPVNKMILPLGLSYIIFTALSYQIEIKRKKMLPEKHFGYFSLYFLFFPKIAQGPIERPQQMMSQLRQQHSFDYAMVVEGLKQILWGYFKKLVVADRLAVYVNAVFNNSDHHNGTTLVIAAIFFAFQIYADFSGYTDIALGSAKIFGFNLTNNFKRPYFATSIQEFWSRWHITLSNWLRDYIFLPLAFYLSKRMKKQKYLFVTTEKWIYLIAIMVTFTICGLWHGEGVTFLVWGLIFGTYLTYSKWTEKLNRKIRKRLHIHKTRVIFSIYKIIITFCLVTFAFIFFKAASLNEAFETVKRIFITHGSVFYESPGGFILAIFGIIALISVDLKHEFFNNRFLLLHNKKQIVRITTIVTIVLIILLIGVFDGGQFIYFQF